ncbi:hypothetical protein VP1G_04868 [Cytospora mali]|uniref:Uncharacterized protein n=1 Tax=Cytospora mali TaxID=578113 RepID=A0A194V109_CYTMA|nr:hypothetical protein VP1G_04868 [Valsa mali var. pyri (nom. inval.)]
MQPNMGHGAVFDTGSEQPVEETKSKPPGLEGSARPQAGQQKRQEQQQQQVHVQVQTQAQAQAQDVQGFQLPYAPSLSEALERSILAQDPDYVDNQALLSYDLKKASAESNELLPTKAYNLKFEDHQQAGATVENAFGLNEQIVFDPAAAEALDLSALPQVLPQVIVDTTMDSTAPPAQPATKGDDKTASIPLICHLCPKKPTFSDVSHLLTHVSSKSHLAAEFKLKHSKKAVDQNALVRYGKWAQEYGVDDLVANRIAAKEQKKAPKRQLPNTKKRSRKSIKSEVDNDIQAQPHNVAPRPNDDAWHLHTPRDNSFDDPYSTPTTTTFFNVFSDSPQSSTYIKKESSRSGTEIADVTFQSETIDLANSDLSVAKLKGTVYPGMSIFDAATEEQRRKRNQKKQPSVLQNMVLTSESVEQYECIWDGEMSEVTRFRNVYDSPSIDGSPDDKDGIPSTGKKRRGRRAAVNSPGPRRQTRASTRAVTGKVGKRGTVGSKMRALKVDNGPGSDDDTNNPLRAHGGDHFEGDADDASLEDDVFQERRKARLGAAVSPIPSHPFGNPNAMLALPTNMPLNTASSIFNKSSAPSLFETFGMKENDGLAFQQSVPMQSYFAPQGHNMQQNGLNPLCVQRQNNFSFAYGAPSFDNSKSSVPDFQSMNVTDYSILGSAGPFHTGNGRRDFDI